MKFNRFYFLSFFCLFSLWVACDNTKTHEKNTASSLENAAPLPLPQYFYKQMKGTINGNLPITLNITREDTLIRGFYFYDNKKQNIQLDGFIEGDDAIKMTEYVQVMTKDGPDMKETGHFEGKWENNELKGTWKNDKNSFPFVLKESYATGAAKMDAKYYHNEYTHKMKKGEVSAHIDYLVLQVSDCGNEAAKTAINQDIMANILTTYGGEDAKPTKVESVEKIMADFISDYKADLKDFEKDEDIGATFNYEQSTSHTIVNNQNNLLSIARNEYGYMGGAHGSAGLIYSNYDLRTGKKIQLSDIFISGYTEKLNTIAEKYFREQNAIDPKSSLSDAGYFEGNKFALNDNFSLEAEGITFQYGQYEIAAYAAGMPSVTIPYSAMKDLLKMKELRMKE